MSKGTGIINLGKSLTSKISIKKVDQLDPFKTEIRYAKTEPNLKNIIKNEVKGSNVISTTQIKSTNILGTNDIKKATSPLKAVDESPIVGTSPLKAAGVPKAAVIPAAVVGAGAGLIGVSSYLNQTVDNQILDQIPDQPTHQPTHQPNGDIMEVTDGNEDGETNLGELWHLLFGDDSGGGGGGGSGGGQTVPYDFPIYEDGEQQTETNYTVLIIAGVILVGIVAAVATRKKKKKRGAKK